MVFATKRRGSIGDIPDTKDVPREVDYEISGSAQPKPSPANACITTGTGCGITAMATLAIRASTKWTSPVGSLATWNFPHASGASAAGSDEDDGETANTQVIYHDYESALLIFEVRGLGVKKGSVPGPPTATVRGCVRGMRKGWVAVRRYGAVQAYDNDNKLIKEFKAAVIISVISSRPSAAGIRRISTPKSSKATSPRPLPHRQYQPSRR